MPVNNRIQVVVMSEKRFGVKCKISEIQVFMACFKKEDFEL